MRWEHTLEAMSVYLDFNGAVAVFKKGGTRAHLARPLRFSLSREEREQVEAIARAVPGVEHVTTVLRGQGLASDGAKTFPFVGVGFDPELQRKFQERPDVRRWAGEFAALQSGVPFWEARAADPNRDVVGVAKGLGILLAGAGGSVQLLSQGFEGNFSAIDADIAHTYGTGVALTEDSRLRMPLDTARRLFDTDGASWVAVFLSDARASHRAARALQTQFDARGLPLEAIPWQDERVSPFYVGVMNFLYSMAGFFFLLIGGVVALAVVNAVLLISFERARETGTLRAVGYLPGHLALSFTLEILALGVLAVIAGNSAALGVSTAVNAMNLRFRPPGWADTVPFLVTPSVGSCLVASLVVLLVAVSAAYVTAARLSRAPVVALLGEERA